MMLLAGLEMLGWFDPTIYDDPPGQRQHLPLRYIPRPQSWDVAIAPNALAISIEETEDIPQGFGGDVEDTIRVYLDLFAQNDELGWQLSFDCRNLLLGKHDVFGRRGPVVDVYDLRQTTPTPFTSVDVDNVVLDRAQGEARAFQRYWFMMRTDLVDDYADEFDATHLATQWNPEFAEAWSAIQAGDLS
jgi:hypothetical protein